MSMLPERLLSSLAVAAVILITAGYFVSTEPEDSSTTSLDGVVTVTGLARQTQPLKIAIGRAVEAPLLGSSYLITPNGVTLDEPAVITFAVLDSQRSEIGSLEIYRFHPAFEMWEPVTPIVAHTEELVAIETAQLGEFALGSVSVFTAPVFANVYDEFRAKAPADAVGYEIAVAFSEADRELVRLLSAGEHGGCGGAVRVGDGESFSRLERQASVEIGDTQQALTFVFVTRWFTSSTGGCSQSDPLRPLVEYDILDEIKHS
ncbi:MAG: hypothetical protein AAB776_00495 [Patescibacteria group bacterium]